MSMLTAQCERLRKVAYEVERIKNNNADWLWRDSITLAEAAGEMRDAADTIAELRLLCQEKTCRNVHADSVDDLAVWFTCSGCGVTYIENAYSHYCCNCGRRIVE